MKKTIVVQSIFEGMMPSANFGSDGQYLGAIGIDPDLPTTDGATDLKMGGFIRPVSYASFSSTEIDAAPIAIITNPKNTLTYVVLTNGKLVSYTSALTSAAAVSIGQVTGSVATGAFYYNNYIYIIGTTDISRYGPLNNSPSLTNGVWTGATLGSQTALVNTTYPATLFSTQFLNHFGVTHVDNDAYFLDYKAGVGYVHKISTVKTTDEGDTNDGSTYNVLDLPFGYMPTSISSFGNDLAIVATPTSDTTVGQGLAKLFLWDTTSVSFYRAISLPDSICSVLKYVNGTLYGISGSLGGGYRLWKYVGGDMIETLKAVEEGNLPMQGGVDFSGNRIVWAGNTTLPIVSSGLYAYGSKSDLFPKGLHHPVISAFT
mgnify:CR=1 FL=1